MLSQAISVKSGGESKLRITLSGIRHSYGGRLVLNVPSLEIDGSETLVLIGPSGAGKSTLMRLLALLETPTTGEVRIDGAAVTSESAAALKHRRRFGVVLQRPTLFRSSVSDNVAYGLRLRGISRATVAPSVAKALAQVGLSELASQPAPTLSGGEAQRLAIARTLVTNPEVLFLDEPTANLDPTNVALIEDVVRKVREETGMTVVLVTHNMHQAERLADRVIFMWNGEPVESGTRDEIFGAPQNPLTRDFIAGRLVY